MIDWTQEEELPQVSVAVQVLAITKGHLAEVVSSLEVILLIAPGPQLSVAVAGPASPIAQSKVVSLGQVTTGSVISRIVIVWTQKVSLPQVSTAVQVRSMIIGHLALTILSEELTDTSPQLSVAVAKPASPIVQSKVVSRGQVITGAVLSRHKLS